MRSDSPSQGWYDPPKKVELEMNWARYCKDKDYQCNKCTEVATMECEVNISTDGKVRGVYCKDHYETLFEDLLLELEEQQSADFDDLED